MKYLALIAMLLSTAAYAEDGKPADVLAPPQATEAAPAPQAVPAPSQPAPKLFYIEVDQGDLNALSTAINELPKRIADPLILKINGQLQVQSKISADYATATDIKGKKPKKEK